MTPFFRRINNMQICAKGLCLGYNSNIIAKGLDFTVNRGDFVAVVGENGSGKTTLVKTLAGLIPAVSGELFVAQGIGYLPQGDNILQDFPASCEEIVLSGCVARPFYSKTEKVRARSVMQRLGILPLAKKGFSTLSGGQKRRVLLARALLSAKELLLLDEPESALDPHASKQMQDTLRTLHEQDGMTVIMISHDIPSALTLATHVLHIGSPAFFGTTDEYIKSGLAGGVKK